MNLFIFFGIALVYLTSCVEISIFYCLFAVKFKLLIIYYLCFQIWTALDLFIPLEIALLNFFAALEFQKLIAYLTIAAIFALYRPRLRRVFACKTLIVRVFVINLSVVRYTADWKMDKNSRMSGKLPDYTQAKFLSVSIVATQTDDGFFPWKASMASIPLGLICQMWVCLLINIRWKRCKF